jgi:hypothetical protein
VAERRDRAPAKQMEERVMSSRISRDPARPDGDFKIQTEFDRWRIAIAIVERMREAGISCELSNDLQNGN